MKHLLAKGDKINDLMNSDYPFKQYRVDCLTSQRYYQINDQLTYHFNYFDPNEFGLNKLNQSNYTKGKTMNLKEKLQAKKIDNSNDLKSKLAAKGNQSSLKSKLAAKGNQSAMDKADLNISKFAEVAELRQTIKDQSIDIVNLKSEVTELSKLAYESNNILAIIAKDLKSSLKAFNGLHPKLDKILNIRIDNLQVKPDISINQADKVITRKQSAKVKNDNQSVSIESQGLDTDSYQGLYEHFKTYFNHKFAKSSKPDQLPEFTFFINGIDFASPDMIDQSARAIWQEYRANNQSMLFAPNSMKLAIDSLIKLAKDFDLMASPDIKDSKVNSEVINFDYWCKVLSIDLAIVQEVASLLKSEGYNEITKGLIYDHIIETSKDNDLCLDNLQSFIDWIKIADNRNNQ